MEVTYTEHCPGLSISTTVSTYLRLTKSFSYTHILRRNRDEVVTIDCLRLGCNLACFSI